MYKIERLVIGLVIFLSVYTSILFLTYNSFDANGEKYVYNMTQEEKEQYNLSELCYMMEADFTIEALDEFCRLSYGDLDSVYGDKFNGTENR